jgi:hypothetical protein
LRGHRRRGEWETHLSTIQDLLNLAQRLVVLARALERLHLLLHQDLDVAELRAGGTTKDQNAIHRAMKRDTHLLEIKVPLFL